MNEGLIPKRYAKAIFRYARSLHADKEVYEKMNLFLEIFQAHPALQKALLNPVLSLEDKELLLSTSVGIEPVQAYMRGIRLLIKNHRERDLRTIALMYGELYRKAHGIVQVNIVTARPLPEEVMERIRAAVRKKIAGEIEFTASADPEIIGGFILKAGSHQLDASVRRELSLIRKGYGL